MKWEKIGKIFDPQLLDQFELTAALMPIPIKHKDKNSLFRVYFSPRDKENRSVVYYFDFDMSNQEIVKISEKPLLLPGKLGAFDDSGITLGSIVNGNSKTYLFYTGWNLLKNVPMNNSIGIAEFESLDLLKRLGDGPVMTRTLNEPYSCASPFVIFEEGKFRMWYASKDKWVLDNEVPKHYYNIKYAESDDGINWLRTGKIAIDYECDGEYAFGRPWVIKEENLYKMWYAYRGEYYKIGYAESLDGLNWKRRDNLAGIDISNFGWDSEMIEYPAIFDYNGERYMLYNGNGYGKTGIGLAKLIK